MKQILSKIPETSLKRLERYAREGYASGDAKYRLDCELKIIVLTSVLNDCGVITFQERIELSSYFRNRIYNGGNAE